MVSFKLQVAKLSKRSGVEVGTRAIPNPLHFPPDRCSCVSFSPRSPGAGTPRAMSPPALMRAVMATAGGALRLTRIPRPSASPGQVLLAVAATAVNRADLLQVAGRYPPPPGVTSVLGLEVAGTVTGDPPAGCGLACGDRVVALLQGGGYADVAAADVGCVLRLPPGWGGDDWAVRGAAIMEAWVAAYQILLLGGCVRSNAAAAAASAVAPWGASPPLPPRPPPPRSVLVTAAAAGVGTAAVQLAAAHFRVPVVIGSASTASRRAAVAALGATATVPRPPTAAQPAGVPDAPCAYVNGVRAAAPGGSVDLLLDAVGGGGAWAAHSALLAPDARWVLYGALGGARAAEPAVPAALLARRVSLLATTLRGRPAVYRAGLVAAFGREVLPELSAFPGAARLAPVVHTVMGLNEVEAAHALVASNTVVGKVVLRVADG